jgi:hypothetical protein
MYGGVGVENKLTALLLECDYDKGFLPEYVQTEDSRGVSFKYAVKFLLHTVWETPCGLLKYGTSINGYGSFGGVDYRAENNNPEFGCPSIEKPCPHRRKGQPAGCNCVLRFSNKAFDYENSVEKIDGYWAEKETEAYRERTGGIQGCAYYCPCFEFDRASLSLSPKINADKCLRCQNEICAVTRKPRNLETVNIVYDKLREFHTKRGFVDESWKELRKGIKLREKVTRSGAEIWLKQYGGVTSAHYRGQREDCQMLFFSEYHGHWANYDCFKFNVRMVNLRIEKPRAKRDLEQDLRDAADGIAVVHDSDIKKAAAASKKEKRAAYKAKKTAALERKILRDGIGVFDKYKQKKIFDKLGRKRIVELEKQRKQASEAPKVKYEQLTVFSEI